MNAIGGYFELAENENGNDFPHKKGILLNTGRNALELILRSIKKIKLIYIPYYTCEVILEPIRRLGIPFRFYHINQHFEIADHIELDDCEYLIVNNYFGIKDKYVYSLFLAFGDRLIVDCAQSFFTPPFSKLKSFYSSRKFIGVADGGIAYLGNEKECNISDYDIEPTETHFDHLRIRKFLGPEAGFPNYQNNEKKLNDQPIRLMSSTTKDILFHVNYEKIKEKRKQNWKTLNGSLSATNLITTPDDSTFESPLAYPYVVQHGDKIRQKLISERIYVAKYWPNIVSANGFELETFLAENLVPLPLDQRYGIEDMNRIINILK